MSQIKLINMNQIEENKLNNRSMSEDLVDCLVDSIRYIGLQSPLVVYKRKNDGMHVILSGHKRFQALKKLGKNGSFQVPCNVVDEPIDEVDEREKLAQNNICRRTDDEIIQEAVEMRDNWQHMPAQQRKIMTGKLKQAFIEKNKTNPLYQEDATKFIANNFRPSYEYIRFTTGMSFSNSQFKRYISKELSETPEAFPIAEKEGKPATVSLKSITNKAVSLAGMINAFKEDVSTDKRTLELLENMECDLRDFADVLS